MSDNLKNRISIFVDFVPTGQTRERGEEGVCVDSRDARQR